MANVASKGIAVTARDVDLIGSTLDVLLKDVHLTLRIG